MSCVGVPSGVGYVIYSCTSFYIRFFVAPRVDLGKHLLALIVDHVGTMGLIVVFVLFGRERREQEVREMEKQHKERERQEREKLDRDRQERDKQLSMERERERQEREQERERLEKQRAAEQAVHKHFEESLRLAHQKVSFYLQCVC